MAAGDDRADRAVWPDRRADPLPGVHYRAAYLFTAEEILPGATMVLGFSVGLALTLVASGAIAALSLKHATRRWPWLNDLSRKAPRFSGLLIIVVGIT